VKPIEMALVAGGLIVSATYVTGMIMNYQASKTMVFNPVANIMAPVAYVKQKFGGDSI